MTSIAIIGPDGAGKTTIARHLAADTDLRVEYLYFGVNPNASNRMLVTTRVLAWMSQRHGVKAGHGPPPSAVEMIEAHRPRSWKREAKSTLRVTNQIVDEWYRQAIAVVYELRGRVVVFDRHYLADFSRHDMVDHPGMPFHRRLHGFVLRHVSLKPDAIVMLDAPPEVLLARKGEGTVESLERRRRDYLDLGRTVQYFYVVDATQEFAVVYAEVANIIRAFVAR